MRHSARNLDRKKFYFDESITADWTGRKKRAHKHKQNRHPLDLHLSGYKKNGPIQVVDENLMKFKRTGIG